MAVALGGGGTWRRRQLAAAAALGGGGGGNWRRRQLAAAAAALGGGGGGSYVDKTYFDNIFHNVPYYCKKGLIRTALLAVKNTLNVFSA